MHRLDVHQPRTSSVITMKNNNVVSQTFLSRYNNLDIVSICLRNPDRLLQPLTFTLTNAKGEVLRTLPISTGNIDNQDCTKFQFDPIIDSANTVFSANVTIASGSAAIPLNARPITVEAHDGNDYLGGSAYLNGLDTLKDLHFKTFYSQPVSGVIQESVAQVFPRLLADPLFFLFYFALFGFLLTKLLRRTA